MATHEASVRPESGLMRAITGVGLAASVINVVIGGGIFVLPALLAAEVGPAAPVAQFIGGVAVLLVAGAFVAIGRSELRSGGAYAYVGAVLGHFMGYVVGVMTWLIGVFASAALLVALAAIVAGAYPSLQQPVARGALILALYAIPVAINTIRIGSGTRLIALLTVVKLATLLLFLFFAAPFVQVEHLTWTEAPSSTQLARGAIMSFFALGGIEMALGASGEIRSPQQTLPWAVLGGMVVVILIYIAVQVTARGVLGPALAQTTAPLADAAARAGPVLPHVIAVGTAVSIAGALVGTLLGSARMLFALAQDGILPAIVGALHARARIPHVAVLLHAAIVVSLAITGSFARLAVLTSVSVALVYLLACVSAWVLVRRESRLKQQPARSARLQQVAAGLGATLLLALLTQTTRAEAIAIGSTLVAAAVLYAVRRPALTLP
jgi:basic amino acid/polyamine antiporter, APA family